MTVKPTTGSDLRILGLGLSRYVATDEGQASDTAMRLLDYGQYFKEYWTIVKTPNLPQVYRYRRMNNNIVILPTLSNGHFMTLFRMIQLGYRVMKSAAFNAIVTQDPILTGMAGLLLRVIFRVPLCISLHEDILDNLNWITAERHNYILNFIGKAIVRHADFVRVVSHQQEIYVTEILRIPKQRVMWAPVRVDTEIFEHADGISVLSELTSHGADRILLFVGRLVKEKNIDFLLHAFAKVANEYPSVCLVLVGDGPERDKLAQTAISLNISEKVVFRGWLSPTAVAEHMAASNILVLSSYYEGFGRVILEAAATGIPVVSTACIGPRELIQDGVTGYLIPHDDIDQMASKLLFLLRNSKVAVEMGRMAKQVTREKYVQEQITHLTIESLRRTAQLGLRQHRILCNANE